MRILFVCQGNTCRSPMAEGMARRFGGETIESVSAGLRPGTSLADTARWVMLEVGIDLCAHRPRAIDLIDDPVDLVISLCDVIAPGLDRFPRASRLWWKVPDPIGGSPEEYRATRDLIWDRLRPLLQRLTENQDLPIRLE